MLEGKSDHQLGDVSTCFAFRFIRDFRVIRGQFRIGRKVVSRMKKDRSAKLARTVLVCDV